MNDLLQLVRPARCRARLKRRAPQERPVRANPLIGTVFLVFTVAGIGGACGSDEDDSSDVSLDVVDDAEVDADVIDDPDNDASDVDETDVSDAGDVDWAACTQGELCVLREPGCCASCTELAVEDVAAVSILSRSEFLEATCDEQVPICDGCVSTVDPHLVAACEEQRCVAYDIRTSDFSACDTDDDCQVRYSDCCECGPELIALAASADERYQSAICDRLDCPDCQPEAPSASSVCIEGHCQLIP